MIDMRWSRSVVFFCQPTLEGELDKPLLFDEELEESSFFDESLLFDFSKEFLEISMSKKKLKNNLNYYIINFSFKYQSAFTLRFLNTD